MDQKRYGGLRLTMFRLVMVPVFYCVVLLAASVTSFTGAGVSGTDPLWLSVLLLLPLVIGVLGCVVRSANPARIWVSTVLWVLYVPALWVCSAKIFFALLHHVGGFRPPLVVIALNTLFLAWYSHSLARLSPRRCPGCQNRTLIPLLRFRKSNDTRTADTRWCGSCGGRYWRDRERVWRPERRKTWLDEVGAPAPASPGRPRPRAVPGLISRVLRKASAR